MLAQAGAKVDYNDPHIPSTHRQREHDLKMKSKKLTPRMLASYDCVLICTNHSSYDYKWIVRNAKLVVDTRNACANVRTGRSKIEKA
jgi:UDP-N-acetyl-D-glucosamine dehydrogenase